MTNNLFSPCSELESSAATHFHTPLTVSYNNFNNVIHVLRWMETKKRLSIDLLIDQVDGMRQSLALLNSDSAWFETMKMTRRQRGYFSECAVLVVGSWERWARSSRRRLHWFKRPHTTNHDSVLNWRSFFALTNDFLWAFIEFHCNLTNLLALSWINFSEK